MTPFCFLGPAGGDPAEQQKDVAQEEDREEVFTVELRRGPHGLGLALVDGTVGGAQWGVEGLCGLERGPMINCQIKTPYSSR